MEKITRLEARRPFVLYVEFDDGVKGEYDMAEKTYKLRINTVARKPLQHDLDYIYANRDRDNWSGVGPWHGVRDMRPLVARKALGFHEPRPHRTRGERVLLISRGPLKGPATNQ